MARLIKSYSELVTYSSFDERYEYLKTTKPVGIDTFGFGRHLNQTFYRSSEWKRIRDYVIARDSACDLGVEGYEIFEKPIIHHINPLTIDDVLNRTQFLLDPEFLITTTHQTHQSIHYQETLFTNRKPLVRTKNDTCPWKK